MKKLTVRLLALLAAFAILLSMAACGGKTDNSKAIEDFVNSEEMQSQIQTLKSSLESTGIHIDVTGEGNKLVYTFTYGDDMEIGDDTASQLEAGVDTMASTFEQVATSLKDTVKVDSVSVEVRYVDPNGKEIYSREFKPSATE